MTKERIIKIYTEIVKTKKMNPSRGDLKARGVTQDMYRHHFTNLGTLHDLAKAQNPEVFKNLIDETVFTPQLLKKVKSDAKKYKKFVITTAVTGMPVHKGFFNNLKKYCKQNNALLLILPTSDPAVKGWNLDGTLGNENIVFNDLELNDNLFISTFKTSAKQVNPLTGIKRIGQRQRSMIVASPKQFLEYVPIANDKIPHALMTTGAVTLPRYTTTDKFMSLRTAYIAQFDHKMGAIIVDIKDSKQFQFRQIQAEYGTGNFIDLGVNYGSEKQERPEALTLGDLHVGETDPEVMAATNQLLKDLKPKRVFLHDVFDGTSISHHTEDQHITRSKQDITLEQELLMCKEVLSKLREDHPYVEEWIIVRSNHDDFIDRYLQRGEYTKDHKNSKIAHKIALSKLESSAMGFEEGLKIVGFNSKKFNFLHINGSYKVSGIECGVHGHLGLNGSRSASNSGLEIGYGPGIYGHSHTAGILREIFRTGTSTYLRVAYNHGASSWTQTHCLLYKNGSRQLINIIDGKYK